MIYEYNKYKHLCYDDKTCYELYLFKTFEKSLIYLENNIYLRNIFSKYLNYDIGGFKNSDKNYISKGV